MHIFTDYKYWKTSQRNPSKCSTKGFQLELHLNVLLWLDKSYFYPSSNKFLNFLEKGIKFQRFASYADFLLLLLFSSNCYCHFVRFILFVKGHRLVPNGYTYHFNVNATFIPCELSHNITWTKITIGWKPFKLPAQLAGSRLIPWAARWEASLRPLSCWWLS